MNPKPNHLLSLLHQSSFLKTAGCICASLLMLPYLLLGEGSIITYHDQLDGELLSYILSARYLFTGVKSYPELMNGLPVNGALPPAPLFVLLYKIFPPFPAFLLSAWLISLVGFLGMFLLLSRILHHRHNLLSFLFSMLFILLPFYPVYGLCIPGQPLLIYAFLQLRDHQIRKDTCAPAMVPASLLHRFLPYLLILLYALSSSLVLVGFAVCGFLLLICICTALSRRSETRCFFRGLGVLLAGYLLTNTSLLLQIFFPQTGYVSHKTEIVLSPQNIGDSFREAFLTGISYAQSYSLILLIPIYGALLFCLFRLLHSAGKKRHDTAALYGPRIFLLLLLILAICLFYALYHGAAITALRNHSHGILREFNLDRVAWLLPTLWFLAAANACALFLELPLHISASLPHGASVSLFLRKALLLALLGVWGLTIAWHSQLKPNLAKLLHGGDYYALDWKSFFASDIYSQIRDAIGLPQDSYHVVSLGIYPAAAAYNGFYCLDGYSNNYPLSYKHTFRKIIAPELDKSAYIRLLFDNWGNRCYITTAEQNDYYTFEKKWNSVIYQLDLNMDELEKLDCRYLFSAAYIMNAQDLGMTLLRDTPFETEGSWYHIYVYVLPTAKQQS